MKCKRCGYECLEGVRIQDKEHLKSVKKVIKDAYVGGYFCPSCGVSMMNVYDTDKKRVSRKYRGE